MDLDTAPAQETNESPENIPPGLLHSTRETIGELSLKEQVNMKVQEALRRMEEDENKWSTVITEILISNYGLLTEENKGMLKRHPRTSDLVNIVDPEPVEEVESLSSRRKQRKRDKKKKNKAKAMEAKRMAQGE